MTSFNHLHTPLSSRYFCFLSENSKCIYHSPQYWHALLHVHKIRSLGAFRLCYKLPFSLSFVRFAYRISVEPMGTAPMCYHRVSRVTTCLVWISLCPVMFWLQTSTMTVICLKFHFGFRQRTSKTILFFLHPVSS